MKILSTAALLCAVSFTPSQASDCANPYGINQERTGNSRCIRVITEIPVGMLDSHCGRCEHISLPSASESCPSKKSGSQSLIESLLASSGGKCSTETPFTAKVLQCLIELTKSLKVTPSASDSENVFGIGGRVAVEVPEAVKEAKKMVERARLEHADARNEPDEAKRVARLSEAVKNREKAVTALNIATVEAATRGEPAFVLEVETLNGIKALAASIIADHFKRLNTTEQTAHLDYALRWFDPEAAEAKYGTYDVIAKNLLKMLISEGATLENIRDYLKPLIRKGSTLPGPLSEVNEQILDTREVLKVASAALPQPIMPAR